LTKEDQLQLCPYVDIPDHDIGHPIHSTLQYVSKDNQANRDNRLEILKTARYDYKLLIRREKSLGFRKLVSKTDSVTSMAKLSKILTKKNADEHLGLLTKPDGTTCKNTAENLWILRDEHFPGSREVRDKGLPKEFIMEVVQNNWINQKRLKDAINQFGEHKT
jgi:hypothetical protein